MNSKKKIVLLTLGQPSTNPRMLKEAETLLQQGYQVKVFYAYWTFWSLKTDKPILEKYPGVFQLVGGDPFEHKITYLASRVIRKSAGLLARFFPSFSVYAVDRPCFFLERAARKEKADLYIGHNLGSLPAAVKAAKKWGTRCGFDAEDYHRGQFIQQSGSDFQHVTYIEEKYMANCDYLTAAAPLIASAYERILSLKDIVVVNNVFSKKFLQHGHNVSARPLRLFWFSQTVGYDRGLEVIVEAINLLPGYDITLSLMGDCTEEFRQCLTDMAQRKTILHFLPPVSPDEIFTIASTYDIGLAAEIPSSDNRNFCLTNKLFTYLLAGNCILASDTEGQRQFLEKNPGIGWTYRQNDPKDLASRVAVLYNDPALLQRCRQRSRTLASDRYNWEFEEKIFLEQVISVL